MAATEKPESTDVDFMSMVSHELTTPLGAIRWNAELLLMGKMTKPLDDEQAKLVDEIRLGAKRMGDLVDNIHEASWLARDKYSDEPTPTILSELIAQVQSELQADITAKNLVVSIEAEPSLPAITARPSTVLLILKNLLSNAVKFTTKGSVRVVLRPATSEEATKLAAANQPGIFLSVVDTGMGIPAAQQDQVFQRFFRAENVRAAAIDGTGLGLSIVEQAVAKLGGAVWFESTEGQGSTFTVVLPLGINPAT